MIAIREKHIRSIRYLWRMFVYSVNMILLLTDAGMIGWCLKLDSVSKLSALLRNLSGTTRFVMYTDSVLSYVYIILFICVCIYVGILISLNQFILHDMAYRAGGRKLLSSIGYRRGDIVRYENVYFLFDFFCAWLFGVAVLSVLWIRARNAGAVQAVLAALGTGEFLTLAGAFLTGGIVCAVAAATIQLNCEQY